MKLCIVNDKNRLIEYNDRMMRTLYNQISAWYTVWLKDNRTINSDNTLQRINVLWKAFKRTCTELVFIDKKQEAIVTNFVQKCEDKYTQMYNEYINRK